MEREQAQQQLRAQREQLRALRVKSLAIFGSVARGEARPDSDLDVLVDFDGPATFDQYMDLKELLEQAAGCRVDLVTRQGLRPELAPYIEKDLLRVT